MELKLLKPRLALNKAFLKVKPSRPEIELFKSNLIRMIDTINESESEEFHKNEVSDFLKNTYYSGSHFINTKGRNDLVIHNDVAATSTVGVIIEAKRPAKTSEMLRTDNINYKAFQELVYYYLRERITHKNLEIKHLIATNIYEWFVFDAHLFEKLFAQNKALVKQFIDFEEKRAGGANTDFFYTQIAAPAIEAIKQEVSFSHFDIRDYEKPLRNNNPKDDNLLIALYKLLSPQHLLKKPFANDSNSLDKTFYSELLHIIGLTEIKEGGKKLIQRKPKAERNAGSLIESAIVQLDNLDKIARLDKPSQFGATTDERLFNVALELSITWVNRVLFLKLLEAQLIKYHKGDASFAFLNTSKVKGFDDLNTLFFQVLAKKTEERNEHVSQKYAHVPYLNSSLFEPTDIEHVCFTISQLEDAKIPLLTNTVIKDNTGKKRTGELLAVEYIFEFLNAYDFSSEGSEEIQEDNKRLINASVLGLIFEKINGYKDGSFFTPGFITMYMCRETIRRAVVQKFNDAKGWNCNEFGELYDHIEDRTEANTLINSLKICDPAVGSGHFLVSALNELIAIKSELRILQDREGKRLKEYTVQVENDELVVTDDDGQLFEYNPLSRESQRVQETLFHEKQTIIENCLFGVDINPNSVKICRLRLWIELLKNAYYRSSSEGVTASHPLTNNRELETLPNIDINIKCGNSLISRFALDADLKQALRSSKYSIVSYRSAVDLYRNAENKEQKREMEKLIASIKSDFRSNIDNPFKKRISTVRGTVDNLATKINTAKQWGEKTDKKLIKEFETAVAKLEKLEKERDDIEANKIYENAFEWRFEFPEVLNDDGDYIGFDVVIGNPPYFIMTKNNTDNLLLNHYINNYQTIKNASSKNIFNLFIELGISISNQDSYLSMIVPEGLFETRSYADTILLFNNSGIVEDITRIEGMVFDEANTGNVIFVFGKNKVAEITKQHIFNKNQELIEYKKDIDIVISRIEQTDSVNLSDLCQIFKGMVVGDRSNNIFEEKTDDNQEKFLLGNCISKWNINKSFYTNYNNLKIIGGTKLKSKHDVSPRILIRRTGNFLCCAYLTEPALTESTLYSCWSINENIDNLFILGVLHSKLADYYIKFKLITNPQAFPQILMTDLQAFPIPLPTQNIHDSIKDLIKLRLENENDNFALESEIDQLVYELYGLTEEEIKIVEGEK